MLQNNDKKSSRKKGLTLIELLVAMAILSIILAGLVMMFVSAIESTHQGYMIKESYGTARAGMELLARDIEKACALANKGEKIQFYGTPNALTFLTILDNGQVGRVTYFFAPSPTIAPFETWVPINSDDLQKRVREINEMKKVINKIPYKSMEDTVGDIPDNVENSLPSNCVPSNMVGKLETLVSTQNLFPEIITNVGFSNEEQAYHVIVQPMAFFRIEEKNQTNITDVEMKKVISENEVSQIMVDPDSNNAENPFAIAGYDVMDAIIHSFLVDGLGTQSNINIVSAIETQTPDIQIAKDLRNYIDNPNYQTIDTQFVNDLINIRKAELRLLMMQIYNPIEYCNNWAQQLSNPENRAVLSGQEGVLSLIPYIWSYDLAISRRDQAFLYQLFTGGTGRANSSSRLYNFWESYGLNPEDYILADGFGAHAFLIDDSTGIITSTDLLYPGALLSYQSEENTTAMYFNDVRSIPLYTHYLSLPTNSLTQEEIDCLTAFLDRMWTEMKGSDPSKTAPFATIFFERLPVRITASAWVVTEKPQPGVSDFRRWFSQTIDIPCGLRTPQPTRMPAGM